MCAKWFPQVIQLYQRDHKEWTTEKKAPIARRWISELTSLSKFQNVHLTSKMVTEYIRHQENKFKAALSRAEQLNIPSQDLDRGISMDLDFSGQVGKSKEWQIEVQRICPFFADFYRLHSQEEQTPRPCCFHATTSTPAPGPPAEILNFTAAARRDFSTQIKSSAAKPGGCASTTGSESADLYNDDITQSSPILSRLTSSADSESQPSSGSESRSSTPPTENGCFQTTCLTEGELPLSLPDSSPLSIFVQTGRLSPTSPVKSSALHFCLPNIDSMPSKSSSMHVHENLDKSYRRLSGNPAQTFHRNVRAPLTQNVASEDLDIRCLTSKLAFFSHGDQGATQACLRKRKSDVLPSASSSPMADSYRQKKRQKKTNWRQARMLELEETMKKAQEEVLEKFAHPSFANTTIRTSHTSESTLGNTTASRSDPKSNSHKSKEQSALRSDDEILELMCQQLLERLRRTLHAVIFDGKGELNRVILDLDEILRLSKPRLSRSLPPIDQLHQRLRAVRSLSLLLTAICRCRLKVMRSMFPKHTEPVRTPWFSQKRHRIGEFDPAPILKRWYSLHIDNPYPSVTEKLELAKETGLDVEAITVWFINARSSGRGTFPSYLGYILLILAATYSKEDISPELLPLLVNFERDMDQGGQNISCEAIEVEMSSQGMYIPYSFSELLYSDRT